jgi:hypothetical protein
MSGPAAIASTVFFNDEGEIRSGWRVLVFFICFSIAATLLYGCASVLVILFPSLVFLIEGVSPAAEHLSLRELIALSLGLLINLTAAIAASWVCARLLERRSLASVGYKLHRGWLRDFSLGSILGAFSLGAAVAMATATGAVRFEINTSRSVTVAEGLMISFFFFLLAGAFEEVAFRGFAFQALVHNTGAAAAILITSTLFGLAHLSNPNASFFSTVNTILAGAWLGIAYLMTRSLWLPTALHYSWNFMMAYLFGLPVSGMSIFNQYALLRGSSLPPKLVSGGAYGPEGGAAATLALILSTLVLWKSGIFRPSEEMLAGIQHGKREPRFISISPDNQPGQ